MIEDDHAGAISTAPLVSLGRHLPARTVHVQSFSKSHGPDLRLAAVGGADEVDRRLVARRLLGAGLVEPAAAVRAGRAARRPGHGRHRGRARTTYAERRGDLVDALHARGVGTTGTDGINLWVEVADEQAAASRSPPAASGRPPARRSW